MGWGKEMPVMGGGSVSPDEEELTHIKEVAVMALSDGHFTIQEIEQMEEILAHNWERMEQLEREDAEACSEQRSLGTPDGTTWTYVIVSDEYVRVIGCDTTAEELEIPSHIEELPVMELAVDACSYLKTVRSVICSPQIEKIGKCAFRECRKLERLVLPRNVGDYDSSWVRNCASLRDLTLPGMLSRITPDIFDVGQVRRLTLGLSTRELIGNPFSKGKLEELFVDRENPYIETDGRAIFTKDGLRMLSLAFDCESYEVPDGCEVIGNKAFANRGQLEQVLLPDSVTAIEDHAFSYSGLVRFDAPAGLRSIGERAFFRCRNLVEVTLNEGLVSIGDEAFTGTGITKLHVPATLERLGMNIADKTELAFAGPSAGFTIAEDGTLEVDAAGGLYRNAPDGRHFVRMLDESLERYALEAGVVEVEPYAFFNNTTIREVVLPEGLLRIGKGAFRGARELALADLPSTVQEVEAEAFLDTSLSRVRIPAGLVVLGELALVTHGAHNGDGPPSLQLVEVDPGNERFYAVSGILVERYEGEGSHVVVYADSEPSVRIPDDVTVIDPYAFGGARNLRELYAGNRIRKVGMRGLSIDCLIEHLYVELDEPIEGHKFFDLHFPPTERSAHELQLAFNLSVSIHMPNILKHYDSAIVNMHAFDKGADDDEIDEYMQAKLALERLADPVLMTNTNETLLMQLLTENLEAVCEAIARHDDRKAVDDMLELGILNEDNLLGIIDHVGRLQDAAMTGYLLEVKRRLLGGEAIDFDL